jgi:hypothetical protein
MKRRFFLVWSFTRCLPLFATAMARLGVGMYCETHSGLEALRVSGYIAFLALATAMPFYVAARRS